MTDMERKDYYLQRIRRTVLTQMVADQFMLGTSNKKLIDKINDELNVIYWNNPQNWANEFIAREVGPLLGKYGICIRIEPN